MRWMALLVVALLAMVVPSGGVAAQETPRAGGVLKVATIGEPPTLDIQSTTTVLTYEIMWHACETLFAYDRTWTPMPHLADAHKVGNRGLTHTITLRKGVKFHNGKEMTATDVRLAEALGTGRLPRPTPVAGCGGHRGERATTARAMERTRSPTPRRRACDSRFAGSMSSCAT